MENGNVPEKIKQLLAADCIMQHMSSKEAPAEKKTAVQPGFTEITVSNQEASEIMTALEAMGNYEVPFWWNIARNKKVFSAIVKEYEDNRNEIINKLAKKNEKGETLARMIGNMAVPDFGNNSKEAEKLLEELSAEKQTISVKTLKFDEVKNLAIKPNIMAPLLGTIVDDSTAD